MPLLPFRILAALAAILGGMFLFVLLRRAWRASGFRRRDQYRKHWSQRLPSLLSGELPGYEEIRWAESREVLESLLLNRLAAAEVSERERITALYERSGLLEDRLRLLRGGRRWQRLDAAGLLGQIGSRAAVPALLEALQDRWLPLSAAALRSLGMLQSPTAAPALLLFLRQQRPMEPNHWVEAAVACVPHPEDFLPLLQDEREAVRALAARALAESPHPTPFEALNPFAFHPDPEVRAQVIRALGHSRDERALPLLVAATQDEVWFVRLKALRELAEMEAVSGLDAVLRSTGDSNFQVRQRAAATLAQLVSSAGEALEKLMENQDRYAVEGFLSHLARAGFLWRSLTLLRSRREPSRRDAEKLLRGAIAAGHAAVLLDAIEMHPEWRVRMAVARWVARLDNPALVAELEQRRATASSPRSRRLFRAILNSRYSTVGDQVHGSVGRPA